MSDQIEKYCTSCPYFEEVVYEGEQWYGAACNKDGHASFPSMYAIESLHNDCPYKTKSRKVRNEK